jgi:hypothetical protein
MQLRSGRPRRNALLAFNLSRKNSSLFLVRKSLKPEKNQKFAKNIFKLQKTRTRRAGRLHLSILYERLHSVPLSLLFYSIRVSVHSAYTLMSYAPGFSPCAYQVRNRFQSLLSNTLEPPTPTAAPGSCPPPPAAAAPLPPTGSPATTPRRSGTSRPIWKAKFEARISHHRFKACALASLRSSLPTYRKSEGQTGAIALSLDTQAVPIVLLTKPDALYSPPP